MRSLTTMMVMVLTVSVTQAYVIQGVDMKIEYWTGTGANECVVAIDWNSTNGPYVSEFHIFGYRWDGSKTVANALQAIDAAGTLNIVYNYTYGDGFIDHIFYNQTLVDGDNHSSTGFAGWWWCGQTQDGGQTWEDNWVSITNEYLWNGGIEGININGTNWGNATMTIPEPTSLILLAFGAGMLTRKKS
jgi:hypothetical protein